MDNDMFADFLNEVDDDNPYEELISRCLEDKGISAHAAIEVVGNDVDSYIDLVRMYIEDSASKIADMEEYIAAENMLDYSVLAHSTKSDSVLIGAEELSLVAKGHELEAKAGNVQYVKENWDSFLEQWNEVLGILKAFIEELDS